jgi:hypothetical protein
MPLFSLRNDKYNLSNLYRILSEMSKKSKRGGT